MSVVLSNNAVGTLAEAISASATQVQLSAGDGGRFPALSEGQYFFATLVSTGGAVEIVRAIYRSGDILGIVRAQEGTQAQSFPASSRFELRVTVGNVTALIPEPQITVSETAPANPTLGDLWLEIGGSGGPVGQYAPFVHNHLWADITDKPLTFPPTVHTHDVPEHTHNVSEITGIGVVNIRAFGAVGDGDTDDTAAIQAAIDYAIANGGEVVIPPGNYTVSATLLADHTKIADKDGVSFRGLGSYRDCRLTYTGTGYCIDASGDGNEAGTLSTRWSMENLSIFGNQNATATGALNISRSFLITIKACEFGSFYSASAAVLDVTNCFNVDFQNCHIYCGEGRASLSAAKGIGVRLGADDTSWSTSNVRFQNCLIQFCDEGVAIVATGAGANVDSVVFDCTGLGSNREYAVYAGEDAGTKSTIRFTNCHIETTGFTDLVITEKTAIYLHGFKSVQVDSCHFNSNNVDIDIVDCNSTFITSSRFFEVASFDTAYLPVGTAIRANNSGLGTAKVVIGPCTIDVNHKETQFDVTNTYYYINENAELGNAYDTRTFVPELLTGVGSVTLGVAQGWYSQVGPMVFFTARVEVDSISTPSGTLFIRGLPLPCEETNRWAVSFEGDGFDLNVLDLAIVAHVSPDTSDIILSGLRDADASSNLASTVVIGTAMTISGCYRARPFT